MLIVSKARHHWRAVDRHCSARVDAYPTTSANQGALRAGMAILRGPFPRSQASAYLSMSGASATVH